MSKSEQKEIVLEIQVPTSGFLRRMYFNRFRMEREKGFCFLQFGLIVGTDLVDSFSCSLPDAVCREHQKTLLEYYARLKPNEKGDQVQWKGVTSGSQATTVVDIVGMSHRGDAAEICFHGFSVHGVTILTRPSKAEAQKTEALKAEPLAILRSDVELQRQLIAALYEE